MIISYAQNREDVLLHRVFPRTDGFYIDVGAADPIEYSVTKWFYDRGWRGINVEPQDGYFRDLVVDRPRDTNLKIALSEQPGLMTLYQMPDRAGWSTLKADVAAKLRESGIEVHPCDVPVMTLAEVCRRYVDRPIDFLKVDVEGAEREVLAGADFRQWRPRIIVVEATEVGKRDLNYQTWEPLVLGADYLYATFDGLNRFYVRAEDRDLIPTLQVPANVFDQFVPAEQWAASRQVQRLTEALKQKESCITQEAYDRVVACLRQTRSRLEKLQESMLMCAAE
jgi:FkbM family methyltransferase